SLCVTTGLYVAGARKGLRTMWQIVALLCLLAIGMSLAFDDPTSETSYFASALAVALSLVVSGGLLALLPFRSLRALRIGIAAICAFSCLMPGYLAGCLVAEALPVGRCFF
ncbi:MAG TPA: hypothetical protein VJ865_16680, partial [Gemmatimonadaceae bacterium]|nr:hypothetical protein [Gemmatimonadaceae bacterium]